MKHNDPNTPLAPMVADHPEAVFVLKTRLQSLDDREGFEEAGHTIARVLLKASAGSDAGSLHPIIKPNIVNNHFRDEQGNVIPSDGVVTSAHFVAGIARFLKESGFQRITVAEGGNPVEDGHGEYTMEPHFRDRGYREIADRMGLDLAGLVRKRYAPEDLSWASLEGNGVVFKEIPFVKPLPGNFLINVPTMKTHYHAMVSLCGKNLQGIIAYPFRRHCEPVEAVEGYPPEIMEHLRPGFMAEIRRLSEKHERGGYWRMDCWYELYAQRTCDTILAARPQPTLNIIEGIRARDGTAFHRGRDWLANLVVAGVNPVHVDTIASYLMGQTPRAVVAYLRIAEERGLGTCDPFAIPTYTIEEGGQFVPCARLADYRLQPSLDVISGKGSFFPQQEFLGERQS